MRTSSRRDFLRQTSALAIGAAALPSLRAASPGDRIVLGFIGPGGQGANLLRSFGAMPDVEIACVCDVDRGRAEAARSMAEKLKQRSPRVLTDMRQVFDDKSIDAVVIATPDHWHAPATILACEAGKHVYVEKPCSHNIREGRLMLEAARRHKRIVQIGTQSRSADYLRAAIDRLHNGAIGDILVAKAWNSQLRGNIGKAKPEPPPPQLDFDLWLGPAPERPYQSNLLPSSWRWFYDFGCGDMGNDGVHDIDIARWGLGVETHPTRIAAMGGKYFFDDDQQFPDTQNVLFEYDVGGRKRQLIFEQRIWSPYVQEGHENGNAWYGTKGMMILGKHKGWQIFGPRNQPGESMLDRAIDSGAHHRNFLDSIRSGKLPNADVEAGHLSAALVHLGNIATRIGRTLHFDPAREHIIGDAEANRFIRRQYRPGHWAVPKGV